MKGDRFERRGASRSLVVLLHGYTHGPSHMESMRRVIGEVRADADVFVPDLPLGYFSLASPDEIVERLARKIDRLDADAEYEEIVLVGHSVGALLARKLYVAACGYGAEDPNLRRKRGAVSAWAARVERIVLLAGTNRGWHISHHFSVPLAIFSTLGVWVLRLLHLVRRKPPLLLTVRRGAPFITTLRIQWIIMRHAARGAGKALTIQLLGSVDDIVSPEDNVDLVAGKDFVYLDVPFSGHADVIEMDDDRTVPGAAGDVRVGEARAAVLRLAFTRHRDDLEKCAVVPSDFPTQLAESDVTDVVFVIHGIRDKGYWTHKIARMVKRHARDEALGVVVATETSTYGYFPMLPFLLPWTRRKKVEWLMDQYGEALARYPAADCSFVGHSNGTYLLARALRDYPICQFKHVVFAGSVVSSGYDWGRARARDQVKKVLNYVATRDWVVAIFPKVMQQLRIQDLGSAGHDGFRAPDGRTSDTVREVRYVRGAHGAALQEANWDSIAHFVLHGELRAPPASVCSDRRGILVAALGLFPPLFWTVIVAILVLGVVGIASSGLQEWLKTLAIVAYALVIWKVVTRL